MKTLKGKFEVKSTPLPADETTQAIGCMRMRFDKKFEGPFEATGVVSMMGLMDMKLSSGGYVALEKITGSIEGKKGSFCFQHSSHMKRGQPSQSITVIADSGTDELQGLTGSMIVDIVEGQHFYTFEYEIKN